MLRKMLTVYLLLTAIVLSGVIPAAAFGYDVDLIPRDSYRWTGSVRIGDGVDLLDGMIIVGHEQELFTYYVFRGFALFDISGIPTSACITSVRLEGNCIGVSTPDHVLSIRGLSNFWLLGVQDLYDVIGAGVEYATCSSCMTSAGEHSIELNHLARADFERAVEDPEKEEFALGFMESGEDTWKPGKWQGHTGGEPVLHVEYDLPVTGAPALFKSSGVVCFDDTYSVHWGWIPYAEGYDIRENGGEWRNIGDVSYQLYDSKPPGIYSYSVRGWNDCGVGPASEDFIVEVLDAPASPAFVTADNSQFCADVDYTIEWNPVSDVDYFEIREDNDPWLNIGNSTQWTFNNSTAGYHDYRVRGVNSCGAGDAIFVLSVEVIQPPTPGAPVSDQNPATVDEVFTISWDEVAGTDYYQLFENYEATQEVYTFDNTYYTSTRSIAGEYTYQVKACTELCCSDLGAELVLTVDEYTAVEEIETPRLPNSYTLSQNYPNPFNPETRIEFSVERAGQVELTVYNILGEAIRSLVSEQLSAGYKVVVWDGCDDSGRPVSSGTYLYKMTAGKYTVSRKMLLIR